MRSSVSFVSVLFLFISWNTEFRNAGHSNFANGPQQHEFLKDTVPSKDSAKLFIGCILYAEPRFDNEEWKNYLQENLALDAAAIDSIPPGKYTASIQFVINDKGRIGEVLVKTDPGYGLGKRAMDIISKYDGEWEWTASPYGRQTKSFRIQPITFVIEEEECTDLKPAEIIP